jgi:mevalonate kinase
VVLDGAKALAIPTKYGQSLTVEPNTSNTIIWKSYNELGAIWFEDVFSFNEISTADIKSQSYNETTKRLLQILKAAQDLNPQFLSTNEGWTITTHQDFNRFWGLGTSSTLINNIADWAEVNAYELLEKTFGGSGYDIACAQHNTPICYQLKDSDSPIVHPVVFNPSFKNQLYFVYLNQKQNSRDGIASYKKNAIIDDLILHEINQITMNMVICTSLLDFEKLITAHEAIISKLIQQDTIKAKLFKDFNGTIKSLGAWGGDFVLVTSKDDPSTYFKSKGFEAIIPYSEMVLN